MDRNLFIANLPPKPLDKMAEWLDTPEGMDWLMNPIVGWDENGNPIRRPLDASLITAGKIDCSNLTASCLICGKHAHECHCQQRNPYPLGTVGHEEYRITSEFKEAKAEILSQLPAPRFTLFIARVISWLRK